MMRIKSVPAASFPKFNLDKWAPGPRILKLLKDTLRLGKSNGSGIRDPQIEALRVEIMRADVPVTACSFQSRLPRIYCMRNSLGWLETRLARNTTHYLKLA